MFGTCETVSGVLCPVWGFPVQERELYTGASPVQGHQDGWGLLMVYDDHGRKKLCIILYVPVQRIETSLVF